MIVCTAHPRGRGQKRSATGGATKNHGEEAHLVTGNSLVHPMPGGPTKRAN